MTSREVILANIEHKPVERPGMDFDRGRLNDFHVGKIDAVVGYTEKRWQEGNLEFYDDVWGNIWKRMVGGCEKGEIHEPVLKDWADLPSLKVPQHDDQACINGLKTRFAKNKAQKFNLVDLGGWIFDNARYLRKMESYLMDMALYPDQLHEMHSKVAMLYQQRIHIAGKAGAEAIFIGEDMGTQTGLLFSPEMFRNFFKETYTRLMALAHEYGMKVLLHSCGQNWDILEDLCDCGVDVFQFDQPMVYDIPALADLFGRRKVALYSPVDIQKVLPTGDKGLIQRQTNRMYDLFDGFIIGKVYPDLPGIGVKEQWDDWAYETICDRYSL